RHGVDSFDDFRVVVEKIVNQEAASRFVARQKLLNLIDALLGEVEVQLEALVRFLRFPDAVGFIGGKKIALRPDGRCQRRGQYNAQQESHEVPPTFSSYSKSR